MHDLNVINVLISHFSANMCVLTFYCVFNDTLTTLILADFNVYISVLRITDCYCIPTTT